jgi:hypothetical protein
LRHLRIISTAAAAILLLALASAWSGKDVTANAAQNPAQLQNTSSSGQPSGQTPPATPPGTVAYVAKRGDSWPLIARHFLHQTSYLSSLELTEAMRQANGGRNSVKAGDTIIVPGILDGPIVEKLVPVPRDFEVRAVYLTGVMAGSEHGLRIIRRWRELGGNSVVFDIKDSDGILNIPFDHSLATDKKRPVISNLPKFARFLHSQNMHSIARIAIFRDEHLVKTHPELAVHSRRGGQPWRENGKLVWTDPSQPKVQEYNIALARFVAESGVDEVQFDYVRFPAEGDQKDAGFVFQKDHPAWHRSDVISDFLKSAYAALHPQGVLLSPGYPVDGPSLRRAFSHDLSVTLLWHGWVCSSGRCAGALYWRVHGALPSDHQRQRGSVAAVAAGLRLAHQDLFSEVHRSTGQHGQEQGRNWIPLLECQQ